MMRLADGHEYRSPVSVHHLQKKSPNAQQILPLIAGELIFQGRPQTGQG
jgi:hypothetical protein